MFLAGLETDIQEFKRVGKASAYTATGGVLLPFPGGYLTGHFFGLPDNTSIFLGLLLCATSVSISVSTLRELNMLRSKEGATILGAAVVDDILVMILLAFVLSLLGTGETASVSLVILKKVVFFGGAILIGYKVLPLVIKKASGLAIPEALTISSLVICLGFAAFSEIAGVAAIIGAYVAGLMISLTLYRDELMPKIDTIAYSFFVPIFFVSIGLSATVTNLSEHLWFILVLSMVAVLTKWCGAALGAILAGYSWSKSAGIGAGMISRGEVALILAGIGLAGGLLEQELFTPVIIMILSTTLVTPPLLKMFLKNE
jgi:Kef-type K+ transport system membrane component KefB